MVETPFPQELTGAIQDRVSERAQQRPRISTVLVDYSEKKIDLRFFVDGDVYDGETDSLEIMATLRNEYGNAPFDCLVLPSILNTEEFRNDAPYQVLYTRPSL